MHITGNIHALKHTFFVPISPEIRLERFVYSFIIFGKKNIYLIDSGLSNSYEKIFEYVRVHGREIKEISKLFLSHSHPDHIGSANKIKKEIGCEVIAHSNEIEWIENIEKQFSDRPVPGFKTFVSESTKVDTIIMNNERLQPEKELSIDIIHTPGHSSGSVSFHFIKERVLISGDAILSPGDLPIYENVADAVSSIKKLQQIRDVKILLSSWDEPVENEMISEKMIKSIGYFKLLHETINKTENAKQLTPMELCAKVIEKLGLPPVAVMPLTAKAFQSNLQNDICEIF